MRSCRDSCGFQCVLLSSFLLLWTVTANADCQAPQVPRFPNVETADFESMEQAHHNMQIFISRTEDYLDCLSPEERKLKMDDVLAKMKQASADYNALRSAYRKHQTQQLYLESES